MFSITGKRADQDLVAIMTGAGIRVEIGLLDVPLLVAAHEVTPHDRRDLVGAVLDVDLSPYVGSITSIYEPMNGVSTVGNSVVIARTPCGSG